MPKRFTDTEKWNDDWYIDLDIKSKLLWLYLCDRCDHAGIFKPNYKLMSFHLGFKATKDIILNSLNHGKARITELDNGRLFINQFIEFQYKLPLNSSNKTHLSIIKLLKINGLDLSPYQGASKGLARSYQGPKDKEKELELDKDRELKSNRRGGVKKFVKPTVDEVKFYCMERNNGIDAQAFIDHYESKGWVVGKSPMKDWKAAIRTWEKYQRDKQSEKKQPALQNFQGRDSSIYDDF